MGVAEHVHRPGRDAKATGETSTEKLLNFTEAGTRECPACRMERDEACACGDANMSAFILTWCIDLQSYVSLHKEDMDVTSSEVAL